MSLTETMRELASAATAALTDQQAEVVLNPGRVSAILAAHTVAVLLEAPRRTWETYHSEETTWPVWIISSHDADPVEAMDDCDRALTALRPATVLDLDEATPAVWEASGRAYPAYQATFTTLQ